MKIDVLMTGQFPANIEWSKMIDVLYRVDKLFASLEDHTVTVRYHTWSKPVMLDKLVPRGILMTRARNQVVLTREPKVYNPYKILKKFVDTPRWNEQVRRHGGKQPQTRSSNFRAMQIMSTCDLINTITDVPDLYIRLRWDALLTYDFDYQKYIDIAANGTVVGFELQVNPDDPWWICKERFERGSFKEEPSVDSNGFWHQHLFDYMIMFKPEYFRTDIVRHWYKNELLLAAEWGWWQTLCYNGSGEHNPHLNINGIVPIIRQIEGIPHA